MKKPILPSSISALNFLKQWPLRIPAPCPLCKANSPGARLCPRCAHALRATMMDGTPRCRRCALRLGARQQCPDCTARRPAFDGVIAGFDYAAPGDALLGQFKLARQWQLAPALAALLAQAMTESTHTLPAHTVITTIPAHAASIRARGFNPAAELARALAQQTGKRYEPAWLLRTREGTRQIRTTRSQRLDAARHDFACPPLAQGTVVAVVDDVMTTGSTLHHAARSLKHAGAAQVWALVLARTPLARDT